MFKWPDGRKYKGEFKNNKQHGLGEFLDKDANVINGVWLSGVFQNN